MLFNFSFDYMKQKPLMAFNETKSIFVFVVRKIGV